MRSGGRLWVVWALGFVPLAGFGQCLTIRGTITDLSTRAPVTEARMVIKTKEKGEYLNIMNGKYQAHLPCSEVSILIEAKGYSSLIVSCNTPRQGSEQGDYYVPFALLPIGHQTSDQPYVQAEQSHTELLNIPKAGRGVARRIFRIADAQTDQSLSATICLFYTQSARKNCFNTTAIQQPEILFSEPDIMAIEVDVPGYQPYKGNLILEYLDGQTSTYTIRLQREVTVVSLISQGAYAYSLSREGKRFDLEQVDKNHHYQFIEPGFYQLSGINSEGVLIGKKEVEIKPGLNTLAGFIEKKNTTTKTRGSSLPLAPEGSTTPRQGRLYFDQSDYRLRPVSQNHLDTLAAWLLQHPGQSVAITGHSDNVGDAQRNQTLSEFRAKVVCTYLIRRGIAESAISWKGVGSHYPDAPNDTETNRRRNRRVDIFLISTANSNK